MPYILALDQGTGGSAALVFDGEGRIVAQVDREIGVGYPRPGWVEQDAAALVSATLVVAREALSSAGLSWRDLAGIGIANQRETTVVWERASGQAVGPAIVWQCRRTAELCASLAKHADMVRGHTGLPIDPYFSATKLRWLLDSVPDGQQRAEAGDLAFGTVDSWLMWRLTDGHIHATDYTNASRTLLFDIHKRCWSADLLRLFDIPAAMLPQVLPSCGLFGEMEGVPILGLAGDQQAALFGQTCFDTGDSKNTYGTGAFLVLNTGPAAVDSASGLLTTLAIDGRAQPCYALEGAVFTAGAAVQWLRDGLGVIGSAAETAALALSVPDSAGVTFVPAFSGLGSPHWDARARGTILGLTGGVTRAHLVRATLEAIAFQSADVVAAMQADTHLEMPLLRADGGGAANEFTMQFQADILGIPVECPVVRETTALGAAYLAGLAAGVWSSAEDLMALRRVARHYSPSMTASRRENLLATWRQAVERAKNWAS